MMTSNQTKLQNHSSKMENVNLFSQNTDQGFNPYVFGYRACIYRKRKFHSLISKEVSGRWDIKKNRKYLWGGLFFWLSGCSSVKVILEYDGTIPIICFWSQELLEYKFTVIHRPYRMMAVFDALNHCFGPLLAKYLEIADILRERDQLQIPRSYVAAIFISSNTLKI